MNNITDISTNDNNANSTQNTPQQYNTLSQSQITFTTLDSVFAWLSFAAGYIFCRVFPLSSNSLGGFLFIVALFTATTIILKIKGEKLTLSPMLAAASAIILSAAFILSENSFLCFLAYTYALATYCYFLYAVMGNSIEKGFSDLFLVDYFKALFALPFYSFNQIFKGMFSGKAKGCGKLILKLIAGIAGTIIPTSIVLLLLSYDKDFSSLLNKIFDFDIWDVFSHIISLGFAIPIGMYVFGLFISSSEHKCNNTITSNSCRTAYKKIKIAPVVTVLTAVIPLLCIYMIFFISQWKYYISGFTGILPEGFSYAEYAREGFFQLCIVSIINFMVIISVVLFMRRHNKVSTILLKALSIIYSLFTLVLISTAVAKMVMYIDCYGLTPKRVYATWLMLVLAIIFILIIIKQFVPKLKAVATSFAICIVMFAALSLSNIESFIAWYNVDRYISGSLETVDMEAMDELGISAVPELVRLAEYLDKNNDTDISAIKTDDIWEIEDDLYRELAANLHRHSIDIKYDDNVFFDFSIPKLKAEKALNKIDYI